MDRVLHSDSDQGVKKPLALPLPGSISGALGIMNSVTSEPARR